MRKLLLKQITLLALLAIAVNCMTACSSEAGEVDLKAKDEEDLIRGPWIQYTAKGKYYQSDFWPEGRGMLNSNDNWEGSFTWKITSRGLIQYKMSYYDGRNVYLEDDVWHYVISDDVLLLDNDRYVRKK